jgi:membrane-bound serine protease (ClpP class)
MPRFEPKFAGAVLVVLAVLHVAVVGQSGPAASGGAVYTAEVEAIIHPVSAEFMMQTMDAADAAGAALVVFTLRTPGGLVDSTRDIITKMLASKTPVAVFVGPSGARAASAGFLLTLAADVAAMAPGTHIGAAHPVSGSGESVDETMAQKAAEDVAAYARTLADGRGRNVGLSEEAVNESRAFTEREAMAASPPLIDLIVPNVTDLLAQLDGRQIRRFDGTTTTLRTAGATIVPHEMSQRQRILSTIAHPQIAFMLLSLGVLGLTVELWSPGAVLPGVVGTISLVLAFFALQLLPVNYAGLLLLMLGLGMLVLEIKVTSYGLLTVGGVVSLVFGAMMLIDAPEPELRLSLGFVLPTVIWLAGLAIFLVRLGLAAQRRPAVSGTAAIIGATGRVLTPLTPGATGQVRVLGEIWRARATEPSAVDAAVRVDDMDGLTLIVHAD